MRVKNSKFAITGGSLPDVKTVNAKVQPKTDVNMYVNEVIKATTVCDEETTTTSKTTTPHTSTKSTEKISYTTPGPSPPTTSEKPNTTMTSIVSHTSPGPTPSTTQYCKCTEDDVKISDKEMLIMFKESLHNFLFSAGIFVDNRNKVLKRTGK